MSDMNKNKKANIKEGYVPPESPKRPEPTDKKGFVPPPPPMKLPKKPSGGKK